MPAPSPGAPGSMYCARVVQRRYRKVNVAGVLWVVLLPAGSGPRWWFVCLLAVYRRYTAQLEAKKRRVHNKWKITYLEYLYF